jgi:hypothetical protein
VSLPLKDFRVAITDEIDAALTAEARAFNRDKQDVAREVLGAWARQKLHAATVLQALLANGGALTASDGVPLADNGVRRRETANGGTRRQEGRR